jgi:hypothetical protein
MVNDGTLPPQYVSGLVDGEGCFVLGFRRDKRYERKGQPEYFYWKVAFAILLRSDDRELLEKVKSTLECGHICVSGGMVQYRVDRIEDLMHKVVPFFTQNPLYGKKREDFSLWTEAVDILYENRVKREAVDRRGRWGFPRVSLDPSGNQRLLVLKRQMETYKAKGHSWKWLSTLEGDSCED